MFFQALSQLFQLASNVKCGWNFLEMNSWRPHPSLEREKKILCRVFTSSIKRAIRKFHVLAVQWRQRNVPKSVMQVQSCCFGYKTYCFFWVFFDVLVAVAVALLKLPSIPEPAKFSPPVRLCSSTGKVQNKTRMQQRSNSLQQGNQCSPRESKTTQKEKIFVNWRTGKNFSLTFNWLFTLKNFIHMHTKHHRSVLPSSFHLN